MGGGLFDVLKDNDIYINLNIYVWCHECKKQVPFLCNKNHNIRCQRCRDTDKYVHVHGNESEPMNLELMNLEPTINKCDICCMEFACRYSAVVVTIGQPVAINAEEFISS